MYFEYFKKRIVVRKLAINISTVDAYIARKKSTVFNLKLLQSKYVGVVRVAYLHGQSSLPSLLYVHHYCLETQAGNLYKELESVQ